MSGTKGRMVMAWRAGRGGRLGMGRCKVRMQGKSIMRDKVCLEKMIGLTRTVVLRRWSWRLIGTRFSDIFGGEEGEDEGEGEGIIEVINVDVVEAVTGVVEVTTEVIEATAEVVEAITKEVVEATIEEVVAGIITEAVAIEVVGGIMEEEIRGYKLEGGEEEEEG